MPNPKPRRDPWSDGIAHLSRIDDHWSGLIARVGPCLLRPTKPTARFPTLVRAIIGQQISTKAAASIDARLRLLAGDPHEPQALLDVGEAGLRGVGLSGVKARYVLNLAEAVRTDAVPIHKFGRWTDDAIVERLTSVKGVGVWTAQMFLIFAMNRPDILPVTDLGIRVAIRDRFGLEALPTPAECHELSHGWRPHRTVAMWYLWRGLDPAHKIKPASDPAPTAEGEST